MLFENKHWIPVLRYEILHLNHAICLKGSTFNYISNFGLVYQ